MMRRSRWSTVLTLLVAVGQLFLPAALSIGDAQASHDGRAVVAHVEDVTRASCKAPHPDDCAVCRYLSGLAATAPATSASVAQRSTAALTPHSSTDARASHQLGFLSRAPPVLLA